MARLFREVGPGHLAWLRPAARRVGIRVRSAAMELARAIRLRRSTREFLAREVPPSLVKRLLDLALRSDIKKLLRIPTGVEPVSIVPIGHPARRPAPKTLRDLRAMIHDERF